MPQGSQLSFGVDFAPPQQNAALREYGARLAGYLTRPKACDTPALRRFADNAVAAMARWHVALAVVELRRIISPDGTPTGDGPRPEAEAELYGCLAAAWKLRADLHTAGADGLNVARWVASDLAAASVAELPAAAAWQELLKQVDFSARGPNPSAEPVRVVTRAYHALRQWVPKHALDPQVPVLDVLRVADEELRAARHDLCTYAGLLFGAETDVRLQRVAPCAAAAAFADAMEGRFKPSKATAAAWVGRYHVGVVRWDASRAELLRPRRPVSLWTGRDLQRLEMACAHLVRAAGNIVRAGRMSTDSVAELNNLLLSIPADIEGNVFDALGDRMGTSSRVPELDPADLWQLQEFVSGLPVTERLSEPAKEVATRVAVAFGSAYARISLHFSGDLPRRHPGLDLLEDCLAEDRQALRPRQSDGGPVFS